MYKDFIPGVQHSTQQHVVKGWVSFLCKPWLLSFIKGGKGGGDGTAKAIVASALFSSAASPQPLSSLIYGSPLTSEVVTW